MKFSIIGGWSNVLNLLAKTRFSDPNYHLLGQSPAFFVLQVEDDFEASSALPMIWSKAENPVSFGKGCLKKDVFFLQRMQSCLKIHQNPSKFSTTSKFRTPHFFHEIISF